MPKPNKYKGNGSKKPEGTVEGSYVMHKGRMVPNFSATNAAIEMGIAAYKNFKGNIMTKVISYTVLALLVLFFVLALSGCQVNVVNVVHSDIGVSAVQEVVK